MKLTKIIVLALVAWSSIASTKTYMHKAFQSMMELSPYLIDEKKFTDPKSEEIIYSHLDNLTLAFKGVHNKKVMSNSNYSPSLKVMRNHIEETKLAFSTKQKYFARNRLNATRALCISCHAQIKSKASQFVLSEMRNRAWSVGSEFEKAEMFYLLRDYPTAVRSYKAFIDKSLEETKKMKKISNRMVIPLHKIELSFKRVLYLYTRTFFKPEKAIEFFRPYKNEKEFPQLVRDNLASWIKSLNAWKKDKKLQRMTTVGQIENSYLNSLATKIESNRDDIALLVTSGRILNILKRKIGDSENAKGLFWLGFADRKLDFNYYYSMADIYLTDCIEKYPKNPVAKRCLSEYKHAVKMGYTGSAGENIPEDLKIKIRKYEQLVGN